MSINTVFSLGVSGIQQGMGQMNQQASKIANYGHSGGAQSTAEFAENSVGLKQSELQVKASAAVAKVAAETTQSLIDIYA